MNANELNSTVSKLIPADLPGCALVAALVISLNQAAEQKRLIATLTRNITVAEAASALKVDGKNAEQRAAAATAMLVVDAEYQRLISELDATKLELARQNAVAEAVYLIVRLKAIDASASALPAEQVQPDEVSNYVV